MQGSLVSDGMLKITNVQIKIYCSFICSNHDWTKTINIH